VPESVVRVSVFVSLFVLLATAEAMWPRRRGSVPRSARWPHNLGLVALDRLVLSLVPAATATVVAAQVHEAGWGLLPRLGLSPLAHGALALILLDLTIYAQHRLFHGLPVLWRLHLVHHVDTEYDVTTASRFHPLEILLSQGIKLSAIAAFGAPVGAVLLFEIILNSTAMFNHANLSLPVGIDTWLRRVIVTPDMHRVHHSSTPAETHSNFGFNIPLWDHLFGSYRAQPALGHDRMVIGQPFYRDPSELRLDRLLTQPFRRPSDDP